ncbi:hypothetical protein FAS33_25355, partial [Salmonella enterica subsp. enterica serovar Newport]|nr:hypothetical protein [Salmonella enterica subsp. enterica serovar Newport]
MRACVPALGSICWSRRASSRSFATISLKSSISSSCRYRPASRRKAEGYFCNMAKELAFLGIQAAPPEAVLVSRNYLTA